MKQFKNISIRLASIFVLIVFTVACEDDSEVFTASETTPVTLSELSIATIELDQNNVNNPAVTFNWNEANFGQQASENYTIEVSSDEAFTNPVTAITVTGTNSATLSVNELNSAAGSAGLPPFVWNTLYARVVSSLGTQDGLPVSSNTINFEVFPFFNYLFDDFYLVGNATAPGWNNNDNNPALFRDADNSNVYYYTGFFDKASADDGEGRFKVLETRGLWQPQWGTPFEEGSDPIETAGGIAGNPGTQDSDPGRFGVTESGFYTFKVDFGARTFTMEPFDASSNMDFTSMTLQGSGVSEAIVLTQSSFDSHIWFTSNVMLVPGDLQFTTNTGSNWGGATSFSGTATQDGGSIPVVVQDEYEVWFNDLTGRYIMIPLNL